MTPLVDIVMVILIFMMLAGSFGASEHYLVSDVPLAVKGTGGQPPPGTPLPTKFTINVRQEGEYYIAKAGNFATVKSTDRDQAGKQLTADLVAQHKAFGDAGINPDDVQVLIFPESNVTLENLIPAMEAATGAGFKKIGFGMAQ
jgi:biopolymer transport protein ExbD